MGGGVQPPEGDLIGRCAGEVDGDEVEVACRCRRDEIIGRQVTEDPP